ncbi:hypothetical protein JOH52_000841 [Sinorhizobium meliloti]|uniref:hypothetical protein n=1 Tax=Rhizobium meliloti TaxID=382 RepID=UPI000D11D97C|nr:hypothetical protein [Sinorhizobium meliloti]MBP2464820.1 hypothetical protein [Sinorhizobium meliloti]MQW83439.1 hypothetical protein [Sinorhizobium meliloti]PST29495.1 hypothetical protein C7U62_02580 [Mesorhizobium loti]GEC36455.1 hypothetical protein EME01_05270 [Sinorhizobium meliloti]
MSNFKVEVTMPDSFRRMIEDGYEVIQWQRPTHPEVVAAFQEMVNLLGMLFALRYSPDPHDGMYFREMDDNAATFGGGRTRTPESEAIGKGFLELLRELTGTPFYQGMIDKDVRRVDEHPNADPGGGMRGPDDTDDDDRL